jgi:hypothetical protein
MKLDENSQSVQSHLSIIQNIIQRMASNSSSSKAWCISLVSAILVIVADKGKPNYSFIAMVPTFLFFILDAYYLGMEKGFRLSYNDFIEKIHDKKIYYQDLFAIKPKGSQIKLFLKSLISISVWPFYCMLFSMIYIVRTYIH